MVAQVADVKTALVSVSRLLKAGNIVHFEPGNCYIQSVDKGIVTPMLEKNGGYEVGLWVEAPSVPSNQGFQRQDR